MINQECLEFMFDNGIGVRNENKVYGTGELERFNVEGDKPNSLNGWLVYRDGLVQSCTFGSWKEGAVYNWFSVNMNDLKKKERDKIRKAATEAKVEASKQRRAIECQEKSIARETCKKIWDESTEHGVKAHPYVISKDINPHGARIEYKSMALLIPVMNPTGISSLQRIFPSGRKMFHKNGTMMGGYVEIDEGYFLINENKGHYTNTIFITEGYATACTIHDITRTPVYVCFNAGNIFSVAYQVKSMNPGKEIVICADNDHGKDVNVGEEKAIAAAKKAMTSVLFINDNRYGTDWNDVYNAVGFDDASAMFSRSFDEMRGK